MGAPADEALPVNEAPASAEQMRGAKEGWKRDPVTGQYINPNAGDADLADTLLRTSKGGSLLRVRRNQGRGASFLGAQKPMGEGTLLGGASGGPISYGGAGGPGSF